MPYKLSPSSLHLFNECKRCFYLRFRKGIRRPDTPFPSLPSGMDKILKKYFDTFRDKGILPPELGELKGKVKLFANAGLLEVWRNNFKGIQWEDKNGNILRGAVDNILQRGKKLIVLDYKTRGFPLKADTAAYSQDQLNIYSFLLRKNGYETEDYAYLLFYHPLKVNSSGNVIFSTDLVKMNVSVKDAEKLFKKALITLKGHKPKADEECGFCEWKNAR